VTRQMTLPAGSSGSLSLRRPVVPSAPGATGFTFRDVLRILRRRMWWIIIITFFTTGIATGACILMRHYRPIYTSMGMVACKVPIQEDILRGYKPIPNRDLIALETANESAYLTSESFLAGDSPEDIGVLGRMKVQNTSWFKKRKLDPNPQKLLEDLKEAFSARSQRGTAYVVVQMSAGNKKDAKVILDDILDRYRTKKREQDEGSLTNDLESLNKEKSKLDTEIEIKRRALDGIRTQANVPGWVQGRTVIHDELNTMNREKMLLEAQIMDMIIRRQYLLEERNTQGYSSTVRAAVEQDPMVMGYRSQIQNIQISLEGLRDRLGVDHQSVRQIQTMMESVQRQRQALETRLQSQYTELEEKMIIDRIKSLQKQYQVIITKFEEVSKTQKDLDEDLAKYENKLDEIEADKRTLVGIQNRIHSLQVTKDSVNLKQSRIFYGTEPYAISFPRYGMFIPGGVFLGLLLSLGLIFLLEFIDDSIKTPSDVIRHLQAPLLGMIPEYDEEDAKEIELAKVVSIHPQELISESFRQVRTNLYFSAPLEELKVMLVTSSSGGCGKTTTAVNLGITFASEGKRVLLVDANFRRSALNRLFPAVGPPRGLSNVLVGQASAADVIRNTGIEGLDVMDAGPAPPNPAVLLSSERMQKLLESQRSYYDHVLIDGPPALLLTDARILAGLVDGTIMVIHAGKTSRGIVSRMLRELKTDKVRILGVLLNVVRPQKGGYFRQSYRSYYDYISHEPERESEPVGALPKTPDVPEGEIPPIDES
jgi:polysaccharide biosynthesis transport protein